MNDSHAGRVHPQTRPFSETGPITVLHVDDEPDFLEVSKLSIEAIHDGMVVETTTAADAVLERLRDGEIDCIVSDYQMPTMDGLTLLERVREEYPSLPFILFTGRGSEEVASEAISAGVTDYLQKNPRSDQFTVLANRIENAVSQNRTEHRFQESQRRYRTLLSNLRGMVYQCSFDEEWNMQFVSNGGATLTGYEPEQLVDGSVSYGSDVIHPADRQAVWNTVEAAVEAREPFRVEYRIITADDEEKVVWEQGRGVYDSGEVIALEGFITDISNRKAAETELEYTNSLLEAQKEATIDGLLAVDENGNVISYNERLIEMWGVPDELIEQGSDESLLEWVVEQQVAEPDEFLERVQELYDNPQETSRDEVRLADGRVFDRYSAPVTGDDGTEYGRLWVFRDITERIEHSQELERQEFLFSRVQEIADIGVWEYNRNTDDLKWSDGIRGIHQVDEEFEPTLPTALEFYHPDDRETIENAVQRALEDGVGYDLELRIVRSDGKVRDVRGYGEVQTDEDGNTDLLRGVFQDITEQKEREQDLQRYKYAFESAQSGIAMATLDGELTSTNPAILDMWGYDDPSEVTGRSVTEFWNLPENGPAVLDTVKAEGEWEGELEAVRPDGSTFHVQCAASTVTNAEGEPIGVMASFIDITDRKERETQLTNEREKYSTLVEQSHDAIAIIQDGKYVFVNQGLTELLGYEKSELLGKDFLEVIAPTDRSMIQNRYERRLDPDREDPPSRYRLRFLTKDGSERVAEVSVSVIPYERVLASLVSVRDITEQQQYELELEQLNEELEILNRVVRHDIRNDMAIILGWAEMLGEYTEQGGEEYLERILSSSRHVVELTETARDYVEILARDDQMDTYPMDLRDVLETEITFQQGAYPHAEVTLQESIPDVEVTANEMLSSVFRNLLNNAVTHNDKETPIVDVAVEERDDDVLVTVSDNGPGIPADQRETIFGKGERGLDSSGTGIGLYLVKTLLEQFGGSIYVEENEPDGAKFTATLPKGA